LLAECCGICPIVKRIWTPSWVLYSGGWCFFYLAAFYVLIEILGFKRWAFPLVVIGSNSIAAYCVANTCDSILDRLGVDSSRLSSGPYSPLLGGAVVLLVLWVGLYVLYRRKIFIRI
jgi:heparan-alpha-glucosaminide N-acetyltransferase